MAKNHKPMISVIVPCYKSEEYIWNFLEQINKQTSFQNIEVIINLNLPSQIELKAISHFKPIYGTRLKVIISRKLLNVAESMNKCLRESSGTYLAIWNIDDLRTPISLQSQMCVLAKEDCVAVTGPYLVSRKYGETSGKLVNDINIPKEKLLSGMYLGPFFMFKSQVLKKIGYFDEQLITGADYDFAVRLARAGNIGYTNDLLGFYLDEGKGLSTKPDSLQPIERTVIEIRYGAFHKIDLRYIHAACSYNIDHIINGKKSIHIGVLFENYDLFISSKISKLRGYNVSKTRQLIRILKGWK
jgi:GT2 family glycosyltransferase